VTRRLQSAGQGHQREEVAERGQGREQDAQATDRTYRRQCYTDAMVGEAHDAPVAEHAPVAERYLELMKRCLTRLLFIDEDPAAGNPEARAAGLEWPPPRHAETMVGLRRLDNVQACVADVLRAGVPGDLIEAGVWRGGTTIFMRAALAAYGDGERRVWAADSFEGLPRPDPGQYPADAGLDLFSQMPELSVGLDQVKANFARYGLLDDRVRFLVGWFKDTLPTAPIDQLAVIRLDGDLYESTMDSIAALYPRLSIGGYVIVDDYNNIRACRRAVSDYRVTHGIIEEIIPIDWAGVYWQKLSPAPQPR
jgi:O-methyltransferase